MPETALIVFIRNPVLGKVKTRIASETSDAVALNIYLNLCAITRSLAGKFKGPRYLYYSDFIEPDDEWHNEDFIKKVQEGIHLGDKMYSAFKEVMNFSQSCILIGSDCPYLHPDHFLQSIEYLKRNDCVIGPALDGGYYLIGLKKIIPEIFSGISWGSARVLNETLTKLKENHYSTVLLEKLEDIDSKENWNDYLSRKSILPTDF